MVSRNRARCVKCPECGSDVGSPCMGKKGKDVPRISNHQSRVDKAQALPSLPLIDLRAVTY